MREDGRLEYRADEQGNRIPDFSYCGYRSGEQALPRVAARISVLPTGRDDTKRIQAAIDFVSRMTPDQDGHRGAILLGKGEFQVSGQLKITASGVVLRGHGAGEGGTTIRATGRSRRSVIRVFTNLESNDDKNEHHYKVIDAYVPVGTTRIRIDSTKKLVAGMEVEVTHSSSKAWIDQLAIDRLGWREGTRDIRWQRRIISVGTSEIELDAPLTLALDKKLSQATLRPASNEARLEEIGIEDVALISDFDSRNPKDEEHAWFGINMQGVRNAWVSRVRFRHFAGGAVILGDQASEVTVVDCASFAPVSELAGYRRNTFFTLGQRCLFLRCWSEDGLHDFSVGHCTGGPNAFVHCYAKNALGDSGPIESCATGVLFDNVRIDGNDLNLSNRWNAPPKTGWAAMNCLLWQCQAANVRCENPPVGKNWAIGIWATPAGNGHFENLSEFVKPISIYQQQLKERVGDKLTRHVGPFLLRPVGATNPTVDEASEYTSQSAKPSRQLVDLIRSNWQSKRFSETQAPRIEKVKPPTPAVSKRHAESRMEITNGWLVTNGKLLTGEYYTPMWWRGALLAERAKSMGPAVTRFAPGRNATGLTDDLDSLAENLAINNVAGYDHHYGLWYDRRRDDHLMVRRADGQVVPPFYEQPFARSGHGTAWDGLSRYDLSKFNHWYWNRLREFAQLGEHHGFVLFHHSYFQHNILEAGAHWADSPWRPANNINATDLPEPPPYIGDKRIFLAEQFYDVSNIKLRRLHRNYIRQCLVNFRAQRNVIQLTSGEYTGPLSFVQFWIDTIVEWEKETNVDVVVALSCTKDVQDAILNDPNRSKHVDVIDIRYWTYTANGKPYAPPGGKNLSPRQHLRQLKPATTSFESIVGSIREYRRRFSNKVVTYNAHMHCRAKRDGWAILFGGGSLPNIPRLPEELAEAIVQMTPDEGLNLTDGQFCLADGDRELILYSNKNEQSELKLPSRHIYEWTTIDPTSGKVDEFTSAAGPSISVGAGRRILWIRKVNRS